MIKTIGLATALAMSVTFVYAQGYGNSTTGTGGPDANMTSGGAMNGPMNSDSNAQRNDGRSAGVNSRGDMTEPGAVKDGANGR
jgi:hypothetical protein